ncbi:MAG: SH3 domain-containing protein [Coraliomargaritaceae bacterium]
MKTLIAPFCLPRKVVNRRIIILALLILSQSIQADDFKAGLQAYELGNYKAATESFRKAVAIEETAAARHNLALSAYQSDLPAEAVWQLERALRIEPNNKEYQFKLSALRQQLGLSSGQRTSLETAAYALRVEQWGWLGTVLLWGGFALWLFPLCLKIQPSRLIKTLRFLCLMILAGILAALEFHRKASKESILISEQASELRAAPAQAAPQTGLARSGERIHILDRHHDYCKVETESEATGWLPSEVLKSL